MTNKELRIIEESLEELVAIKGEMIKFLTKQQEKYEETPLRFAAAEREIKEQETKIKEMKAVLMDLRSHQLDDLMKEPAAVEG